MISTPWTRGDILDLHIFILLLIWFTLDRSEIYFSTIRKAYRLGSMYLKAFFIPSNGAGGGH
jgi:hypothetical protein